MMVNNTAFGNFLKALRHELGLSQADFAARMSSTQRHLSFLETGRAQPGRPMIQRIEREFALPISKRLVLYEAAGFTSPYKRRDFESEEVREALDLIENRLLLHWPFPGFVLDRKWNILRANIQGRGFLENTIPDANTPPNLFRIFTSKAFRERILNWDEVAPILATRLYREAADDEGIKTLLKEANENGLFAGIKSQESDIPIFVPVEFRGENGDIMRLTSLLGQLASVQDAIIEGMTVELMVPMDIETEHMLLQSRNDKQALEKTG